jgi:hypothetical protein
MAEVIEFCGGVCALAAGNVPSKGGLKQAGFSAGYLNGLASVLVILVGELARA